MTQEYDYVVIRLAKSIGDRPAQRGGGAARGWLSLPDRIDVLNPNLRLVVHQHPERAPQQFDIGNFIGLDPSGTCPVARLPPAHAACLIHELRGSPCGIRFDQ